ncbi:MAG: DASH family cryptochrome [Alkalibacterium sp.]|nr:DASH family cryptochrome [Alkalibacterium sp.]
MRAIWYRHDLRVHDHAALFDAVQSGEKVHAVYVWDERFEDEQVPALKRMGSHRRLFLIESLEDLLSSLNALGIELTVLSGHVQTVIPAWLTKNKIEHVYINEHPGVEERQDLDTIIQLTPEINWHKREGHTLFSHDQLPFDLKEFPMSFTRFRKKLEKELLIPKKDTKYTFEEQQVIQEAVEPYNFGNKLKKRVPARLVLRSEMRLSAKGIVDGGEAAALERLIEYVGEPDYLFNYKNTRDGLLSFDDSSKLSFWLASGCLSPKRVYQTILSMESKNKRNESSYWLFFELLWREYFQWLMVATNQKLFRLNGLLTYERQWSHNQDLFDKWKKGLTGYPLIDAAMTELNTTGYMSNRARQNVASFLTKNLGINWLWGARYFEEQLIDYDPASNYGNWAYQAGVGTDMRELRAFNVVGQGIRYDSEGDYVKHWLKLPADLPGNIVYDPYKLMNEISWKEPVVDQQDSLNRRRKEWGL